MRELGYSVEVAAQGDAGLEAILASRPDLVLCEPSLPRSGALDILQRLSGLGPQRAAPAFILLTGQGHRQSEIAGRPLVADCEPAKPRDAMPGVTVEGSVERADRAPASGARIHLTRRENDVLTWVARGKTSAEIAIIIGLSERTVNFHCENAIKRLDAVNRTQAVAKGMAQGLIGT